MNKATFTDKAVAGILPLRTKFFLHATLYAIFFNALVSCIQPIDRDKAVGGQVDTSTMARLAFFLDKASYDSCLVVGENIAGNSILSASYSSYLDSNSYLLTITSSAGRVIYDSTYIGRPDVFYVQAGTYKIRVVSGTFTEPSFFPLFGQEQTVKAIKDSTMRVQLISRQLTGGIRFTFTTAFTEWFKGVGLYLKRDTVMSKYGYGTRLYKYFYPGEIQVIYKNKDGDPSYTPPSRPSYADTILFKRKLKAAELVTISLDYDITKVSYNGFGLKIDTARIRKDEYFNLGGIAPYGCISVWYAQNHIGDTLKLFGYIVGGDATTTTFKKVKPFASKTHIVVGAQDWQSLREKTIAIELPNGEIRRQLNLVDHPELIKKPIVIDGIVSDSYFGYPGMKNITSYQLLK